MTSEAETNGLTVNYTYDQAGNRAQMTVTGAENCTTVYTYDANNCLLTETKAGNGETVTTTYTYDPNGNTLTKSTPAHGEDEASTTVYAYNGFNQLVGLNIDGTAVAYAYNAQGIHTAKRVNNLRTAYLLDGGNVVAEVQNNTVTDNYLRGINLIRRETARETEYYLFNAHGDVVTTTNLNGTINQSYDYDAFGNEKAPDPLDTNPFRYCGEYLDGETGTYYLRARYYDPTIGRFTQQDTHWNTANMVYGDNPQKINEREDKLGLKTYSYAPQIAAVIQSGNLYVYSINNPVQYIDPSGNIALIDDLVVAGLVILAATAATYAAAPLLTKMLQEMGKTFTDIYNMTAKEIQWLIERASGNTAVGTAATTSSAMAAPAAPDPDDKNNWHSISNRKLGHILNEHDSNRFSQQLKYLSEPDALSKLSGKSFFNSTWSEQQILDAVNSGYNQALQMGVHNGPFSFTYLGELVTVYLKDGILQTAYGAHTYTYAELMLLLGV